MQNIVKLLYLWLAFVRDVYLYYDPISSGYIGILPEGPLVILVEVFEALKLVYFKVVLPHTPCWERKVRVLVAYLCGRACIEVDGKEVVYGAWSTSLRVCSSPSMSSTLAQTRTLQVLNHELRGGRGKWERRKREGKEEEEEMNPAKPEQTRSGSVRVAMWDSPTTTSRKWRFTWVGNYDEIFTIFVMYSLHHVI
jgi:hypothetical protein